VSVPSSSLELAVAVNLHIGLMIHDLADRFFATCARAVQQFAAKHRCASPAHCFRAARFVDSVIVTE
jgi:hypothetical protein